MFLDDILAQILRNRTFRSGEANGGSLVGSIQPQPVMMLEDLLQLPSEIMDTKQANNLPACTVPILMLSPSLSQLSLMKSGGHACGTLRPRNEANGRYGLTHSIATKYDDAVEIFKCFHSLSLLLG